MKRFKLQVYGKVQGIGYRYHAVMLARAYGIRGFVQNMPNKSVIIEAEGEYDDLKRFLKECKEGPAHAYVSEFTEVEIAYCNDAHFLKR